MSSETDNQNLEKAPEAGAGSEKPSEKPARKPRKSTAEKKAPRARKTTGVKKATAPRKTSRKTKVAQQPSSEIPAEPKTQKVSIQEVESPVYETPEIKTSVKANSVMTQVSEPTVTLSEPVASIETKQPVDAPAVSAQSERGAVETPTAVTQEPVSVPSATEASVKRETKQAQSDQELSVPVREDESEIPAARAQQEKAPQEQAKDSEQVVEPLEKTERKEQASASKSDQTQDETHVEKSLSESDKTGAVDSKTKETTENPLLPQICKSLWAKLAVVLVVVALCCTLPYWWYFKRSVDLPEGVSYVDVTVPTGASGRAIANRIAQAGIGVSPDTLIGLLRVQGTALSIHAGRYRFTPGMTLADIVDKLQRSDVEKFSFRIADGMPLWELRKAVTALSDIEIKTAGMSDMQLRSVLGIQEPHLEGVFAPETYSFRTGLTDIDVYRAAYREQMRILNDEWEKKSPLAAVKTKYEALILASIIEKETSMRADRALVSSVFNNRLRLRMPLQTDPTIIYGIGESFDGNLKRRDLQQPGPYNTYLNAGLPPTPISMPSAASIHAALNPQDTKFLYFVARGDGTTHFSKTLTEHNRAVEKYQKAPARKARALQKRQKDAR